MSLTRERLVLAATELFARQGVRGTTNADVQAAVGLARGSGALYKHFPSKAALVEAVVDAYAERLATQGEEALAALPSEPRAALAAIASAVESAMRAEAAALRIVLRELDDRPDLAERTWAAVVDRVYGAFAVWVEREARAGRVRCAAPRDRSAVLMAALTLPYLTEALVGGETDVDTDRPFGEVWVDVAAAALGIDA